MQDQTTHIPLYSGFDPGLLLTITTRPAINCSS
jgi:hypothetical protein